MDNALFLQSEVADPYALYAAQPPMRRIDGISSGNVLWAVYSHAACREVLLSDAFGIPPASTEGLGETACTLVRHLARLANPPRHAAAKEAALRLHGMMRRADTSALVQRLVAGRTHLDWVDAVCRKLPVLLQLESFGFASGDIDAILPQMEALTKIMAPQRSPEQLRDMNAAAGDIYPRIARHLAGSGIRFGSEEERHTCIVNCAGLLIQSVDAGRGLLANTLLQVLRHLPAEERTLSKLQRAAAETLRFDPPIHNTRRIALRDTVLCGEKVWAGETVLVVLAAANRDAGIFSDANCFDWKRNDGDALLSFGAGIHECVARHLSVQMTAEALSRLFDGGRSVELLDAPLEYEPAVNARLVKRMEIRLG
jgi:cytochrome P450